ncbi:hypothetical protein ScPMuIL_017127 [Solemya velum]
MAPDGPYSAIYRKNADIWECFDKGTISTLHKQEQYYLERLPNVDTRESFVDNFSDYTLGMSNKQTIMSV